MQYWDHLNIKKQEMTLHSHLSFTLSSKCPVQLTCLQRNRNGKSHRLMLILHIVYASAGNSKYHKPKAVIL